MPADPDADRHLANLLAVSTQEALNTHLDGATPGAPTLERLQLGMLMAIHLELRRGHDQAAAHTAVMEKRTTVLDKLAHELSMVAAHLGDR
ncbi:hypothetical protein L6E12_26990 [Actinokineospora sp. PR83]|uniref:hypothetical protein n=1 Tax=Actinokineospora sp. PR83 TaxID=2884908 RepID=UPI001F47F4A4|nr:hypothetical protein [Actinokineospora sp. PR83]MCG8919427.1 hypothetical protein [Actinokineospora sp. PR83]